MRTATGIEGDAVLGNFSAGMRSAIWITLPILSTRKRPFWPKRAFMNIPGRAPDIIRKPFLGTGLFSKPSSNRAGGPFRSRSRSWRRSSRGSCAAAATSAVPSSMLSTSWCLRYSTVTRLQTQLAKDEWLNARRELAHRLDLIGAHAVKLAKDVPETFADAYFALMPIHEKLRDADQPPSATICGSPPQYSFGIREARGYCGADGGLAAAEELTALSARDTQPRQHG